MAKYKFVIARHGESEFNRDEKVTGWEDTDLTDQGERQARCVGQVAQRWAFLLHVFTHTTEACKILKKHGYMFDVAFTSVLKRTIKTLYWIQDELDLHWVPTHKHWRLNERHQGVLQGTTTNKDKMSPDIVELKKKAQSFDQCVPGLEESDERWNRLVNDPKYKMYSKSILPKSESTKMASERFLEYWHGTIVPEIKAGHKVLIVGHSNIFKSFQKFLFKMSDEEFSRVRSIPVQQGKPLMFEVDENFYPLKWEYLE